jgi:hypothetical protein
MFVSMEEFEKLNEEHCAKLKKENEELLKKIEIVRKQQEELQKESKNIIDNVPVDNSIDKDLEELLKK